MAFKNNLYFDLLKPVIASIYKKQYTHQTIANEQLVNYLLILQ